VAEDREGTVFIAEDVDAEDPYLLTGRFSAHWEGDEVPGFRAGPEGVSAEEAIAWGRLQADVVLIRLADSDVHHSAGSRRPPPEPGDDFPVWPEGRTVSPRRLPGMEHLDLQSAEPIAWEVRLPRPVSRRRAEVEAEKLRDSLANDPAVSNLRVSVERGRRVAAVLRFVVRARNHAEAMQLVFDLEGRTLAHHPHPDPRPWWRRWGRGGAYFATGWDPVDGIRPAGAAPGAGTGAPEDA
jgi:hypothetical protein